MSVPQQPGNFARGELHQALFAHFAKSPINTPHDARQVLDQVMIDLGRDDDRSRKAIRKSFYKMVDGGYMRQTGRGSWALTESGMEVFISKSNGQKPAPKKNIDASPLPKPKPPTPEQSYAAQLANNVGTLAMRDDLSFTMRTRTLDELNRDIIDTSMQVDKVEKATEAALEQIRETRRMVEKLKMDRAISEARATKERVQKRLAQVLDTQQKVYAELASLRAEVNAFQTETPSMDNAVVVPESNDGDDGDEGDEGDEGDDDPDLSGPDDHRRSAPDKNYTSEWLSTHLRPTGRSGESKLMRAMKAAVRSKCPISAQSDKVEDHIQEFLLKLVRRDGLRKKILAGDKITYSHLASYAVRSAWTDARNAGTEPVEREMYGARTERERREWGDTPLPELPQTKPDSRLIWGGEEDGNSAIVGVVDAANPPDVLFQQRKDFEVMWSRIETVMRSQKPQAWERYSGILRMKYQGLSTDDIAEKENVSTHRAASLIQEAKSAIRAVGFESLMA